MVNSHFRIRPSMTRFISACRVAVVRYHCSNSTMDSIFLTKNSKPENRTFYQDDRLPPLPLPSLKDTCTKYLDSCRPILNDEEYGRTFNTVQHFIQNDGNRLHQQLKERSKVHRNWLDDWWLDGYLLYRGPAAALNFTGISCLTHWPFKDQVESFALQLHLMMKFWQIIRDERLRQQTDARGNPFSMFQFKSLFNTCRIPYDGKDELVLNFKTKYEGNCPNHIIIFHKNRLFKVEGVCKSTGKILSPAQFHRLIVEIMKTTGDGPGIAFLTELKRDEWAAARSHLIDLSPQNQKSLKEIETAAFCGSISDGRNMSYDGLMRQGMFEISGLRWMDKLNIACNRDNELIIHTDHTPLDGMVIVTMLSYFEGYLQRLKQCGLEEIWGDKSVPDSRPLELLFEVDNTVSNWICEGSKIAKEIGDASEVECLHFEEFGKSRLRKLGKIHPCAFIQICLQYAYMKMHGEPASTYETATTRVFYKGRTETMRTCTMESVKFCKAMISNGQNKRDLFLKACDAYHALLEECKVGRGCDRHLLGLSVVATENGEEMPSFFTDPGYAKSGSGGNFVLSTSVAGYGPAFGGVLPFREDGYGAFYRINDNSLMFVITAYLHGSGTNASRFKDHLKKSLTECCDLLGKPANL